jgi:hypothetical protein
LDRYSWYSCSVSFFLSTQSHSEDPAHHQLSVNRHLRDCATTVPGEEDQHGFRYRLNSIRNFSTRRFSSRLKSEPGVSFGTQGRVKKDRADV